MSNDKKHARVVSIVADRFRAAVPVTSIVGERVLTDEPGDKDAEFPRVTVKPGKHWPAPSSDARVLRQADVIGQIEAKDEATVLKVARAVRRAVAAEGFLIDNRAVVTADTGAPVEDAMTGVWSVRDVFSSFTVHDPDAAD